jgi:hypothetical protein
MKSPRQKQLECFGGPLDGKKMDVPLFIDGAAEAFMLVPASERGVRGFVEHIYEVVDGKYVYRGKQK